MIIYPAIDLKNGQCVRLTQGDFNAVTVYESDPVKQAKAFADAGAEWIHMVDLDGAQAGEMQQFDLVARVAREAPIRIQVGGGIRSERTVERLLKAGASRVVVGSLAVKNHALVKEWLQRFGPDQLTVAFDIRFRDNEPEILTHGWQSGSQQVLWDILESYEGSGLTHLLCTDVSRDGMMSGANGALYQAIHARHAGLKVMASGGVSGLDDLLALKAIGVHGAVVGKAIYEGKLELKEALEAMHAR